MPPRLIGDDSRLRQILFNLVGNAIKFTVTGSVRVEMRVLLARPPTVLVCVADSGIRDRRAGAVFEPFVQGENTYVRRHQGAGLGLGIVKRLVGLMRGSLAVDNAPEGTTVCISLPLRPASNGESAPCVARGIPARNLRILLAEDDAVSAYAARRMLERDGHEVRVVENGSQALDTLRSGDFDLVLMDVQMPVLDGVNAARLIRADPSLGEKRAVPIIALTAYAMAGDRDKFLAAGMTDYVAKPLRYR